MGIESEPDAIAAIREMFNSGFLTNEGFDGENKWNHLRTYQIIDKANVAPSLKNCEFGSDASNYALQERRFKQ